MIRDGFIRVAASTPEVKVADVEYNREQVCEQIEEGRKKGASMMVFPELVLTDIRAVTVYPEIAAGEGKGRA